MTSLDKTNRTSLFTIIITSIVHNWITIMIIITRNTEVIMFSKHVLPACGKHWDSQDRHVTHLRLFMRPSTRSTCAEGYIDVRSQPVQRTTKRCPSSRPTWLLRTLTLGSRLSLGTQITASYNKATIPDDCRLWGLNICKPRPGRNK